MKHKLKAIMLAMVSAIFVFGANANADTISIVSDTAYAPFEFKDSDQVYKGIDVDIINEVANREGWNIDMTFPGFDAAVNAVQAGQADALMAGTTVTEARKKVFTFSDTYYDTAVVVYTRSDAKVSNYKQLSGKTVGVKNGTAAQAFLKENQNKYGYKIKTFDTSDLMNNSLDAGSIYAAMDDQPVVQYAISQGKNYAINIDGEKVGSFAFAVKKGSKYEYLIDEFNQAFAEMKKDGTYDAIMAKWLGDSDEAADQSSVVASSSLKLSGDASAKATPVKSSYKIVMDSSFAPFEYQNDSGKYEGIDVDLIKAIAKQQGFNIEISNPGFDAALNAVQTGQADGVMAGMSITDARKKSLISQMLTTLQTSCLLLKRKDSVKSYDDLSGKTVGAKNGTSSYTWLSEHAAQYGYTLRAFDEASTMYDSLNSGSIEALMDDEAVLRYAIKQGRNFDTPIDGEKSGEYGFAVNKGANPELLEMFNNGLAALVKSGEYDKIVSKYLGSTDSKKSTSSSVDETTIWGLIKNNYSQLLTGLGTTLSLTLISFAIAMVIGIIFGMMAVAPNKVLRTISAIFVDVVRGIPLMIVAAFIFWGIPNLIESMTGHQSPINDFLAATIALSLNAGAYIAEIVRGGIEAVPKGQMEASRSLGISYGKTMKKRYLATSSSFNVTKLHQPICYLT